MMVIAALPEGAIPLAVGTALALGGLSLVLAPLIGGDDTSDADTKAQRAATNAADVAAARTARPAADGAVEALREIEFDRATGKLSDSDYLELKQRYTQAAIDEMRALKRAPAEVASAEIPPAEIAPAEIERVDEHDPVEAAIQRARAMQKECRECGPRPEPDAEYCSACGKYLARACQICAAPVEEIEAHFCSACGAELRATVVTLA